MPKYTKSVRKNSMKKMKRGRSRRGGYWFYPSPGDDEHAFTKLKNKFSTGNWKFWQKQPEFVPLAPVSSDYSSTTQESTPTMAEPQQQGSLEYPSPETPPMESSPPMDQEQAPMDQEPAPVEPNPETPTAEQDIKGGRRRRQKRTTKKRKRSNMRRRTNKRRRSNKRRR